MGMPGHFMVNRCSIFQINFIEIRLRCRGVIREMEDLISRGIKK